MSAWSLESMDISKCCASSFEMLRQASTAAAAYLMMGSLSRANISLGLIFKITVKAIKYKFNTLNQLQIYTQY